MEKPNPDEQIEAALRIIPVEDRSGINCKPVYTKPHKNPLAPVQCDVRF